MEANKALLKNYQANSHLVNVTAVTNIMALSLMRLPASDYLAVSYLLPKPAKVTGSTAFKALTKLAELLERALFEEAWAEYAANRAIFDAVKGFEAGIKSFEKALKDAL